MPSGDDHPATTGEGREARNPLFSTPSLALTRVCTCTRALLKEGRFLGPMASDIDLGKSRTHGRFYY